MRYSQPVLKEAFIAIQIYLRKIRKRRLTICLEALEKEKQNTKGEEGNTEGQSRHKWNRSQKNKKERSMKLRAGSLEI